ncbi:hypothetical protein LPB19_11385 [Marinobacter salinisoli]|uniref:EAL domain-containing protein n=1 Tax=Marinobacter salinisoli TaxID=2769486 RepID=A0ABX7MU74_9GAMM|nr:hypothetical protein [Marinobacter salinisoli]QSP93798.1 hypothetical protein LPB19_11385 [Marinobacter salinisoli]
MNALAYLHEHGLDAENLMGNRIAVCPEDSITPVIETWIIEQKLESITVNIPVSAAQALFNPQPLALQEHTFSETNMLQLTEC